MIGKPILIQDGAIQLTHSEENNIAMQRINLIMAGKAEPVPCDLAESNKLVHLHVER